MWKFLKNLIKFMLAAWLFVFVMITLLVIMSNIMLAGLS